MKQLKCEKCGGKLKLEDNSCVCLDCGTVYNFLEEEKDISSVETSDIDNSIVHIEEVIETNTENKVEEETPTTPKKKINWLGWILGLSLVVLLVYAFVWMSGSDERAIKEVLADNGYYDLEIVAVEDLGNNIEGLAGNNKFVLIKKPSGEQKYGFGAVNIEDGTFQDFEFGYTPLNVLMLKVFSSGEQMNIDNFNKAKQYVEEYGYYCLNNQEHAENYIREITGENGFLPCEVGRKAIIDNISYILPNISSLPQSEVIFEDDNANPAYYAGLSKEMKYRWNHVFPESVYKVWEASVDRETQNITKAMYGQPYELQEVWAVVDKNLKEVGTYKSLESAKAALQKTPTTKNNSSVSNSSEEQETKDNSTTTKQEDYTNPAISNIKEKSENYEKKSENELVIGYTLYEPFAYKSNGSLIGFDIDLAKEVCSNLGLSPVFMEINWDDRVSLLNSGEIDCVWNGMVKSDRIKNSMVMSDVYLTQLVNYDGVDSTEELVIGFKPGSSLVSKINSALSKAKENGIIDNLKSKYNID